MPEFPPPIQLPGQPPLPREPYAPQDRPAPPTVVDEDADVYGAEDAAARLTERLRTLDPAPVHAEPGERPLLTPPLSVDRDRIEGPASGRTSVVVFGAHGTPASRSLGAVLDGIRERHVATVGIAWRHYPDPDAHPRAAILALAVEAAAVSGRFWTLTRDLLRLHHHDPRDLHGALVRSWLDPAETLDAIRERHIATVGIAWRHYPDPDAHPRAAILALAIEAAAVSARFWTLTRELLKMRHHDPADLHAALVRSWLDPAETLDAMRAGVGTDRIAADVSSAQASAVVVAPTLFIDGERFAGEVESAPVLAAVDAALRARGAG